MTFLEAVNNFHLEVIPATWVNELWNSSFNGDLTLPDEYKLHLDHAQFSDLILNLIKEAKKCSDFGQGDSSSKSKDLGSSTNWNQLIKENVNYKALICLLSTFIKDVDEDTILNEDVSIALKVVRLYVNLLSIPGAWNCRIFKAVLFDRAMTVLKLGNHISSLESKQFHTNEKSEEESTSVDSTVRHCSEDEKRDMMLGFWLILHDLTICFKQLKMKNEVESLIFVIQMIVNLTRYEKRFNIFESTVNKLDNVGKVALKSYSILEQLCSEDHGKTSETAMHIMKYMLPSLIITEETLRSPANDHDTLKKHTFSFIKRLLTVYGDAIAHPVFVLAQHLFIRIPDKADIRAKAVPQVIELIHIHNYALFKETFVMLVRFTQVDLVKHRICAIELIAKLLTNLNEGIVLSNDASFNEITPLEKLLFCKFLFAVIFAKTVDISPSIRHKCLSTIADLIPSNNVDISQVMHAVFDPTVDIEANKEFFDVGPYLESHPRQNFMYPDDPLPSGYYFMEYVEMCANDMKVFVRKSALHVIANLFAFSEAWIKEEHLKLLVKRCWDRSVLIRKLVSKSLTELILKYPSNNSITKGWVKGAVSVANDIEVKSRENAVEYMKRVILNNITYYNQSHDPVHQLPWRVIELIVTYGKDDCLTTAFHTWSTQKAIKETFFDEIKSHVGSPYNHIVWFLITSISQVLDIPSPEFIYDYFCHHTDLSSSSKDYVSLAVLQALEFNRSRLTNASQAALNNNLKSRIENFSVRVPFIGPFFNLCYLYNSDENKMWCGTVLQTCESLLQAFIAPGCTQKIDENMLSRYILTLGEANNFCSTVNPSIASYLANIIDPTFSESGDPPRWNGSVSGEVKAVAVLTLGRICLQSSATTKKYVTVFVNMLTNPRAFLAARNNSMAALSDLYIGFPSVVSIYLTKMFISMKDRDPEVRKNSLKLILRLLKEDTVKLKNPLFFYLLSMLLDNVKEIKNLAKEFFEKSVLEKNKNIMCHSFVQAAFFFNGFFENYEITKDEKNMFSLAGDNNFAGRAIIYKYMLKHMPDDDKFTVLNRLCLDVLEEVVEDNIPLDLRGSAVLKDALSCMGYEEMRMEIAQGRSDDDSGDQPPDADAFRTLTDKVLIHHVVKKNYIEQVMPVVIKLRTKLSALHSPLTLCLMNSLKEMMKPYKDEVNEIFAADAQLASELEYDLRDFRMDRTLQEEFDNLGLEGHEELNDDFQIFQSLVLSAHEGMMG